VSLSDPEQSPEDERSETIRWVHQQISVARQVAGTPGEQYLKLRGLRPPWPTSLMWSDRYQCSPNVRPRACLIAKVTNPAGDIVAVQSTEIDLSGMKAQTDTPRISRGPISEGTVFLGDAKASPSTLVLGEGIETVLTRCSIGPCDAHACLGALRFVKAEPHHRRVEILADTNAREAARRMARAYAKLGHSVFVVTVPDSLGPKADLNDALRELGSNAVLMAIEDAERFTGEEGSPSFDLAIGSDVEIARKIIERLEDLHGPIIVCEGRMWRFDKTHWAALNDDHVVRFVHCVDGTPYPSSDGKRIAIVKLNKNRVTSIIDAALKYRGQADFFQNPPCGINCESGFIRIADDGTATLLPHARQWRQRHVVRGHWPVK
jgi:hypothetical protein